MYQRTDTRQANTRTVWTKWYNTDTPKGEGDFECLSCLRKRGHAVCKGSSVIGAECRVASTRKRFTSKNVARTSGLDRLDVACTKDGLVCRNKQQPLERLCRDYEVRFRCKEAQVAEQSMFWWIGILALVFVVLPISWAIIVNVRRRCRNQNGDSEGSGGSTRGLYADSDPSLADPPPTYDQLFGDSPVAVPSDSSNRYGSTQALLVNEIMQPRGVSVTHTSGQLSPAFISDHSDMRPRIGLDMSDSPIVSTSGQCETVSGPVSDGDSQNDPVEIGTEAVMDTNSQSDTANDTNSQSDTANDTNSQSDTVNDTNSQAEILPQTNNTESINNQINSQTHSPIIEEDNNQQQQQQQQPQQQEQQQQQQRIGTRRLPGMHIPCLPILRQISDSLTTPPPTYDDYVKHMTDRKLKDEIVFVN